MSFYDDASLVFLPSGGAGKDTKAYSIKPTDGSGDFTFSRGSNLTSTRIDSNGLIEKGRENLLLQSNQFDTTWVTTNASVTSGQTGYDGSSDAWLLEATNTASILYQNVSSSGVQTISVYAKAGTTDNLVFYSLTSPSVRAGFDLTSGSVNYELRNIDASIEDVGNGWYRCSMVFSGASTAVRIYPADSSLTATIGDNIYIQDAQLEQGLVATEYIESGASTGLGGLLEDSPRFDYSGGASCPSLLLEPSRTNLIGYSEYANGSGWVIVSSGTIVDNVDTSPEGVVNAFSFETTTFGALRYNVTLATSTTYTFSFYAKNVDATIANYRVFDITNSSDLVSQTSYFSQISTSEWSRIEFSFTTNATSTLYGVYPTSGNQNGTIQFYGAQLEQASYSTSYIPNHSGGSVTREADECTKTSISGLIGQTEGTIYCEFEYNGAADSGVFNRIIGLGTGVTQNRILLAKNDTTAELVAFAVTGGTTQVFQAIAGTSIIGHHKVAISYKANEYKVYLDGELEFTDTSASVPATTDVYIGTAEDGTNNNELGGVVKQSIIYKEVLSEDNCKALTTL